MVLHFSSLLIAEPIRTPFLQLYYVQFEQNVSNKMERETESTKEVEKDGKLNKMNWAMLPFNNLAFGK